MRTLGRLTKTTFQRISRNPYHSVGAVFIMFLTFFVGGVLIILSLWSNAALKDFESRPQIDAFFKDSATQKEIDTFKEKLNSTGNIASIKFISKKEALEIYKDRNKDDPLLTEFVTADILPSSFQISARDINNLEGLAEIASSEEIVENIVFKKDVAKALSSLTNTIRNVGTIALIFLAITSILITLIVISLNISLHKDEIETMRLVGATKGYIRTPFILEGVFYGLAASFLATSAVWLVNNWISPFLGDFFQISSTTPITVLLTYTIFPISMVTFIYLFAAEAAAGIIIGAIGSAIATRKYLKV